MIKKFYFEEKEIRSKLEKDEFWFSGQDIFEALGMTWKGVIGLKQRSVPLECTIYSIYETNGGSQKMVFINKEGVAILSLCCRKLSIVRRNNLFNELSITELSLKINRLETMFMNSLKPILNGFGLEYYEQYPIGKYKIDMYVPCIGFIEYDELNHSLVKDQLREKEICSILDKPFYRCKQGEESSFLKNIVDELISIRMNNVCNL